MANTSVSLDDIESTTEKALVKHGALPWVAQSVARAVREAEATGNLICGLYYLESYCLQLQSGRVKGCLLYTSPSPRDRTRSRMPSSA